MGLSKRIFTAIWLIAILATPIYAFAQSAPRAVLIVDESAPDTRFGHRVIAQVHSTLDAETRQRYTIHAEFLDLGHFNGPDYNALQQTYLNGKYRNMPINVIVAFGSDALEFVSRLRADRWPEVPIVFVTFADALVTPFAAPPNATGVIVVRQFQTLVKSAQLLVPNLKRIALVGESLKRQPRRHQYQQEVQQLAKDLDVIDLTDFSLDEVKKRVTTLPDDAAIVYMPIYTDETGISHDPAEAFEAVADVAKRPIVVDSETLIGMGATGGFVISPENLGEETGRLVARILNGEDASNIPIATKDFAKPVFDGRKLKQWGIDETTLPAGSDVRFRELNVWDRYRWQIIAIAVTIPFQSLIIAWLFFEHRRRIVAERESHQHLLEVTKMDRAMTASAMSASIGHELNQPLSAILNNAETAEILLNAASPDRDQLKEILADIRRDDQRAVEIIKHLRMMLKQGELDPRVIDVTELVSNTVKLIGRQAAEHGVTIQVEPMPANLQIRADRVHIQQVLLNLAMNAIDAMENTPEGERKLELRVSRRISDVMISIEDTGTGIPDDKLKSIFQPFVTTKQQGTGLGLSIAQTIVGTYGGKIWAENAARGGAIFHFTLNSVQSEAA